MIKRIITFIIAAAMAIPAFADGRIISAAQLPEVSRAFITEHFPTHKILQAVKDGFEYEVMLDGAVKLEFDNKGQWKKVDCEHGSEAVPEAVIPPVIADYVKSAFPGSNVTSIKKDRREIEVELDDSIDLKFDHRGRFLRIDD